MNTRSNRVGLAVTASVVTVLLTACGSDAGDSQDAKDADPVVLSLPATGADMKCAAPSAELLGGVESAFEATVSGIDESGDTTLVVSEWMAGADQPDEVTIKAPETDLSGLVPVVHFEEGKDYLVSASDGAVSVCGLSGEKTPELSEMYAEAFGG